MDGHQGPHHPGHAGAHRVGGAELSDQLHLSQLRKAKGLTQEAMAELLGVTQAEVSKMERRSELYIGTLKKFIEAMDGELVLAARFPDGTEVPIRLAEPEPVT